MLPAQLVHRFSILSIAWLNLHIILFQVAGSQQLPLNAFTSQRAFIIHRNQYIYDTFAYPEGKVVAPSPYGVQKIKNSLFQSRSNWNASSSQVLSSTGTKQQVKGLPLNYKESQLRNIFPNEEMDKITRSKFKNEQIQSSISEGITDSTLSNAASTKIFSFKKFPNYQISNFVKKILKKASSSRIVRRVKRSDFPDSQFQNDTREPVDNSKTEYSSQTPNYNDSSEAIANSTESPNNQLDGNILNPTSPPNFNQIQGELSTLSDNSNQLPVKTSNSSDLDDLPQSTFTTTPPTTPTLSNTNMEIPPTVFPILQVTTEMSSVPSPSSTKPEEDDHWDNAEIKNPPPIMVPGLNEIKNNLTYTQENLEIPEDGLQYLTTTTASPTNTNWDDASKNNLNYLQYAQTTLPSMQIPPTVFPILQVTEEMSNVPTPPTTIKPEGDDPWDNSEMENPPPIMVPGLFLHNENKTSLSDTPENLEIPEEAVLTTTPGTLTYFYQSDPSKKFKWDSPKNYDDIDITKYIETDPMPITSKPESNLHEDEKHPLHVNAYIGNNLMRFNDIQLQKNAKNLLLQNNTQPSGQSNTTDTPFRSDESKFVKQKWEPGDSDQIQTSVISEKNYGDMFQSNNNGNKNENETNLETGSGNQFNFDVE